MGEVQGTQSSAMFDSEDIQPSTPAATSGGGGYNAAPGLTALGGLTQAFGQYQSGKINASIANYNANLARLQAGQASQAGMLASTQEAGRERQREGNIAASYGAQGISGGTASTTAASSRNMSAMDRLVIETNARRQAYGFTTRAASDETQAALDRSQARTAVMSTALQTGAQEELEQDPNYGGLRFGVQLH